MIWDYILGGTSTRLVSRSCPINLGILFISVSVVKQCVVVCCSVLQCVAVRCRDWLLIWESWSAELYTGFTVFQNVFQMWNASVHWQVDVWFFIIVDTLRYASLSSNRCLSGTGTCTWPDWTGTGTYTTYIHAYAHMHTRSHMQAHLHSHARMLIRYVRFMRVWKCMKTHIRTHTCTQTYTHTHAHTRTP